MNIDLLKHATISRLALKYGGNIADVVTFHLSDGKSVELSSLNGVGRLYKIDGNIENIVKRPIKNVSGHVSVFFGVAEVFIETEKGAVKFSWKDGDIGCVDLRKVTNAEG